MRALIQSPGKHKSRRFSQSYVCLRVFTSARNILLYENIFLLPGSDRLALLWFSLRVSVGVYSMWAVFWSVVALISVVELTKTKKKKAVPVTDPYGLRDRASSQGLSQDTLEISSQLVGLPVDHG